MKGVEPSSLAWKAMALPLSYTRNKAVLVSQWGVQDSNLRRHGHQIYSLTPLTARETPHTVRCNRSPATGPVNLAPTDHVGASLAQVV